MTRREGVNLVVREWVAIAENDLTNAVHTLLLAANCPTDTVCFHAQQCVEKYIKAFLVSKEISFPKTHDLEILIALLPVRLRPRLSDEEQSILTDYATGARYPGWSDISLTEARRAVAMAKRVRKEIRKSIPKEALQIGRK